MRPVLLVILLGLLIVFAPAQADEFGAWGALFHYQDPAALLAGWPAEDVILLAAGDVLLARSINARMVERRDFTFPFRPLAPFLRQADLAWVNLETPFLPDCPVRYVSLVFCGDPRAVVGLRYAGIDVVNLANNHTENYGERGVRATEALLRAAQIAMTGLADPVVLTIDGQTIGLLGFNDTTPVTWVNSAQPEFVAAQIQAVRPLVDHLIVAFHWGVEYETLPRLRQRNLARLAIESGADVVLGHHPHWVQGIEIYRDKPILYSLGNFVFDQGRGGWFNEGLLAALRLRPGAPIEVALLPIIIEAKSTPRLADPAEAARILRRIRGASAVLES